jgi:hypothetical protein
MSKFNQANTLAKAFSANGNLQYVKPEKEQLYELVVNTLYGRDTFYETTDAKAQRLSALVAKLVASNEFNFLANLAVHARHEMNVRNMPVMLVDQTVKALKAQGKNFAGTRTLVSQVVGRVDQITDLLALLGDKAKMPMALKRGLSDAFNKFSEYQFAKYNRAGKVTLKDAMRIVHPVPKDVDMSILFDKIMKGNLSTPDTWEVALSRDGNTKEVWEGLIDRKVLGYQATLKNLRNMLNAGVSADHQRQVAKYIVDFAASSKSLPFEFLASMEAIKSLGSQILNNALIEAMDASVVNVPSLGNKVLVLLDTSGSMGFMEGRAVKNASFLSAVLASASKNCEKFTLISFASNARRHTINTSERVFSTYEKLVKASGGGSTDFLAGLIEATKDGVEYDTVIVLTDNEMDSFKHSYNVGNFQKQATRVIIDCSASETSIASPYAGWHHLAGWSPNMFRYLDAVREGTSMVEMLSQPFSSMLMKRELASRRWSSKEVPTSNVPKAGLTHSD